MTTLRAKISQCGIGFRAGLLSLAMLLATSMILPGGRVLRGNWSDLPAAMVAAAVCLAGAMASLLVAHRFRRREQAMISLLLGMAFRTGFPFFAALSWHFFVAPLADGAFVYYLLLFYLAALAVERALSLPPPQAPGKARSPHEGA